MYTWWQINYVMVCSSWSGCYCRICCTLSDSVVDADLSVRHLDPRLCDHVTHPCFAGSASASDCRENSAQAVTVRSLVTLVQSTLQGCWLLSLIFLHGRLCDCRTADEKEVKAIEFGKKGFSLHGIRCRTLEFNGFFQKTRSSAIAEAARCFFDFFWRWIMSWPWNLGYRSLNVIETGAFESLSAVSYIRLQ